MSRKPPRGRGATRNPANRFLPLYREPLPDYDPAEDPAPQTLFFRDSSQSALAENDSPDIPFQLHLNPYRGCEHGCSYCLGPDTPILYADMTWRRIGDARPGDAIVGFDEYPAAGSTRRYRPAIIEAVRRSRKPTLRVVTANTEITTTAEHLWLDARYGRWCRTDRLTVGEVLWTVGRDPGLLRVAGGPPRRAAPTVGSVAGGGATPAALPGRDRPPWRPGGDPHSSSDFSTATADAPGAIASPFGAEMELDAESIRAIVPGPVMSVVDIQTSTRTFLADGVATHNCFARPTHEYLSFSAGLDFETRIMVKEDAPRLLRKALLSPKWEPQPVGISGVTDAYQPIERRALITRRCLEVFAEFRNPVGVVTKSALVARDKDVLAELARHQAAAVFLSITTLDAELARQMEPRAAAPHARLRAVRELTDAGVPCGVMFAPVIPGLNDHEAAEVLKAAAEAGAVTAGFVFLRLPFAVKDLFADWLGRHFPDRKAKVLGRVRDLRGGKLNEAQFGKRMTAGGPWAEAFRALFRSARRQAGMLDKAPPLSTAAFRRPGGTQLTLFE